MADDNNPGIIVEVPPDRASNITPEPGAQKLTDSEIVQVLEGYRTEAEYARLAGPNSRDLTWLMNLDLYWNRFDFSKKAPWQARELMPELPQYVDRFAAAMRQALRSSEYFFTVKAANDEEQDLADVIRKIMVVQLRRVGRSPSGHPIDFLNVFEETMKFGALMMNSVVVTYKVAEGEKYGYVCIEPTDPYNIWLDPTGRHLYRIRRTEIDLHELHGLKNLKDKKGMDIYNSDAINTVSASIVAMMRAEREKRTGTGQWTLSNRRTVVLHEYLCTIIDNEGKVQGENVLCVVANNTHLIRGPEKNPFWHKRDWVVTSPIITVPLSPYGRGYVENFASIARTFNELTNLLLDGVFTSALKAFAAVPSMLEDPSQIEEGVYPNVVFRLAEGMQAGEFIKEVSLGQLPPDAFQLWGALKKELQEGAAFNELTLGNLAPKSRTSATEIGTADQNSTSYIRSIATNIETLFLEPVLDLLWKTTIQHLSKDDKELEDAIGEDWFRVLLKNKRKFVDYRVQFVARGISSMLLKAQKAQQLMQLLQVVQGNPLLLQAFLKQVDMTKLLNLLYELFDIEKDRLIPTPRERLMNEVLNPVQQLAGPGGQQPPQQQGPQGNPMQPSAGASGGQAVVPGAGVPAAAARATPSTAGGYRG